MQQPQILEYGMANELGRYERVLVVCTAWIVFEKAAKQFTPSIQQKKVAESNDLATVKREQAQR